jgi:hypothetical protein
MICPLFHAETIGIHRSLTVDDVERMAACKETACGWWVPEKQACALKVLASEQVVYQLEGPVGDLPQIPRPAETP